MFNLLKVGLVLLAFASSLAIAQQSVSPPCAAPIAGTSLQDPFLNALQKERISVSIYLVNGIKLQGQIQDYDSTVILLKNSITQMVYKNAISTIVPAQNIQSINSDGTVIFGD